ncbi:MAG: alpha/beta fold hydrolase, partial [Pirellulales bacterium]
MDQSDQTLAKGCTVMKRIVSSCVVIVCIVIFDQSCFSQQMTFQSFLDRFDSNNDKLIQKDEAKNLLLKNFSRVDTNSDGQLDEREINSLVKRLSAAGQNRRQGGQRDQQPIPDSVRMEEDISYREGSSKKWKIDIYYPSTPSTTRRPGIVFVHGGGWRSGDKGTGLWRSLPVSYAEKGFVCISVNYRLLDEASFPACIEDCKNAVRWLRAHADMYSLDPNRVGAFGISAGAHLVAMLGLADRDVGLEGDGPYKDVSSQVQSVVCCATPTNFLNWDGTSPRQEERVARFFPDLSAADALKMVEKVSPITHVRKDIPFLVIHGTADTTVPIYQGDCFVEALKQANADVTYIRVEGARHGVFAQSSDKTYPATEAFFN